MTRRTWQWATYSSLAAALLMAAPAALLAGPFPGAEEAVGIVFPGTVCERETFLLEPAETARAAELAGQDRVAALVTRYIAWKDEDIVGYAYLDRHRVRTLPEVLMVAVDGDGALAGIQVLAFGEPREYMAREGWFDQFIGKTADDEIRMKKNIDGITGATLTARATTQCARRVLTVHEILKGRRQ